MKLFLLILIAISSTNYLHGQRTRKVNLPELKENYKVDSVINFRAIKINSDNECILINVNKYEQTFYLAISNFKILSYAIDLGLKRDINTRSLILAYTDNIHFFYYKSRLVFVIGSFPADLFTNTKHYKRFIFMNKIIHDSTYYIENTIDFEPFIYKNKTFTRDVEAVH